MSHSSMVDASNIPVAKGPVVGFLWSRAGKSDGSIDPNAYVVRLTKPALAMAPGGGMKEVPVGGDVVVRAKEKERSWIARILLNTKKAFEVMWGNA